MTSRAGLRFFAAGLCAAMLFGAVAAEGQGKGNANGQSKGQAKKQNAAVQSDHEQGLDRGDKRAGNKKQSSARRRAVVLTSSDQNILRDYYRNTSSLPPGLAKRDGDLPPGLRKHLRRNGTLPPGLQKRFEPLSTDLEQRLSPLPLGDSRHIRCESDRSARKYCWVDTFGGVRLSRQLSDAFCREGTTWGYTTRAVWVRDGCRADFEVLPTTYQRGVIGNDVVVVENRTQRIIDVILDVVR